MRTIAGAAEDVPMTILIRATNETRVNPVCILKVFNSFQSQGHSQELRPPQKNLHYSSRFVAGRPLQRLAIPGLFDLVIQLLP